MKTKRKRVLALVLCLTLVLDCAGIAYADNSGKQTTEAAEAPAETELPSDTISDDEAVYVLTDAAGNVENIANGEESVTKTQEQKDLPVDVRFTYRLDGREIAPEELAGKSGRVEIRIDYTNNAWAVKEISGKEENLCVPFLTLSALLLDNEHFSNVTVENGKLVNAATGKRPIDLSITKNVLALIMSSLLLLVVVLLTARWYRKHDALKEAPTGLAAAMEPLVMMVHEMARENIGEDYRKFSPYLCMVFLWILLNNFLGIMPFFPGGANLTGNIAITLVLALFTFFIVNLNGSPSVCSPTCWRATS